MWQCMAGNKAFFEVFFQSRMGVYDMEKANDTVLWPGRYRLPSFINNAKLFKNEKVC